jgi:hypothetical protein
MPSGQKGDLRSPLATQADGDGSAETARRADDDCFHECDPPVDVIGSFRAF